MIFLRIVPVIVGACALLGSISLAAQTLPQRRGEQVGVSQGCGGSLANSFGPFDYRLHANSEGSRTNPNNPLFLVHSAHFRPEMEALIQGGQGPKSPVAPEFDYTLRAFPNHHRALVALVRLVEREKNDQPQRLRWPVECYFERAVTWAPDDALVRMLFAKFLSDRKRLDAARRELATALSLAGDNALTHQNIGLLYLEIGDIDAALAQSHRAFALGMTHQPLRDRLQAAGRWMEPPPTAASGPAPAASVP
jgi:tetratricopeptide (TPR) repeat protein